jgi:hypothetical protein
MISRRPDGWSWISNFHICWTRVRTMLTDVWTVVFELRFLPYEWARPDRNPRRPDGWINLPLFELGKKIWSWSITRSRSDGLLSRPDRCKLEQKLLDTVKGPDGNPRRPNGWCLVCRVSGRYGTSFGRSRNYGQMSVRTGVHIVRTAGREPILLTCKQCRIPWDTSE